MTARIIARVCDVDGCDEVHLSQGYCSRHYRRFKKYGSTTLPIREPFDRRCDVEGCEKKHLSEGYCVKHFRRWQTHGDPLYVKTTEQRCKDLVKIDESGCHLWQGTIMNKGYGQFRYEGKAQLSHRVSYRLFVGEIPEGMKVLHTCDNPPCINPEHLFLGTHKDNMSDMTAKGRGLKGRLGVNHGEGHGNAKFTDDEAEYIRSMRGKMTGVELARMFHVNKTTISQIQLGRTWTRPSED